MTDIIVTHSYQLDSDPKQKRLGQPFAPLGTLYAAAVLREREFSTGFYDSMFKFDPVQIIPLLQKEKPGILIIYEDGFSYLNKMCLSNMRQNALKLASLGHLYGAKVIVNSPDANDNILMYLDGQADFIILGEAEITLIELVGRIMEGQEGKFDDIPGIAFKKDGRLIMTKPRPILETLDDLPFPAWDLLDMEAYRKVWKSKNNSFTLNMVTTRGCPYNCIWCAKPIYGNHYNSRSPGNVVEEMLYLKNEYSPDQIWFADDIFGLKPGWMKEFSEKISLYKPDIPFSIQSRVDLLLGNDQVASLAKAGCKKIWLGIESGSQKILDTMQKGITVEQIHSLSPILRKAGIEQAFFLQLGFPGEEKKDIDETIQLVTELMPDDIGISVTYPLPGTRFYDSVKNTMKTKSNWDDSDELSMLFKSSFPAEYYRKLHRYIHKLFRFRQSLNYINEIFHDHAGITGHKLRRIVLFPWYLIACIVYKLKLNNKEKLRTKPIVHE
jgi:anaerobic magnesium-protoporphyrin IX monomethyl ester cyclase